MSDKLICKYKELENILKDFTTKNAMQIANLSMSRTCKILNIISGVNGFETLNKFKGINNLIFETLLYKDHDKINSLQEYVQICEDLIPLLDDDYD